MKLSNQQIDALVSRVCDKKEDGSAYEAIKLRLMKDPKNIALAKKYASAIGSIPERVRRSMYINKTNWNDFLLHIIKPKLPHQKEVSRQDIRNKILIASIESETLDQLQKKLRIKL